MCPEFEQPAATREVEVEVLRGSGEWWALAGSAGAPEKGSTKVGDRSFEELDSILLGSTSESLIGLGSVSTPLGREAGVVGGGGENTNEEGVGEGLDASVTRGAPGILMVEETRRSMGSLAK